MVVQSDARKVVQIASTNISYTLQAPKLLTWTTTLYSAIV